MKEVRQKRRPYCAVPFAWNDSIDERFNHLSPPFRPALAKTIATSHVSVEHLKCDSWDWGTEFKILLYFNLNLKWKPEAVLMMWMQILKENVFWDSALGRISSLEQLGQVSLPLRLSTLGHWNTDQVFPMETERPRWEYTVQSTQRIAECSYERE